MGINFIKTIRRVILASFFVFINPGDVYAQTDFSPAISVSLSNTDCDSLADLTISVSQDAGEVDMLSALYTSNVGSFDISNMNIGDIIGSALLSANSGSNTFNAELTVTTVVSSSEVVITSTDINTGLVLGSFTILNLNPGISISATTVPDGNNFTSGNSSTITFTNVFINPGQSSLVFTTTLDSELGDQDIQSFSFTITCLVTDFSPAISVSLSNTDCDSLADLTISVSQDAGEVDMLSALYTSNVGSFDISNMNIGDVIGSALLSANSGSNTFNAELTVTTVVSSSEVVITSTDINTGLVLGSFTILNLNPGISISATTVPDGNNFTSGNSSTITFTNVFINPGQSSLVFTTTLDSELGDQDIQSFSFTITCLVTDFSPAISVSLSNTDCDSLADLTISVSQDAGEVDMLSALYTSNVGSFDISNMNIGDVIGSALLSANSGSNTFNAELTVTTVVSSSEVVITSTDINTGLVLGSFTILNLNPGISISATTVPDGNNFTSGNSSTITFMNVFINPGQSSLVFTTTLDSELGDQDIQSFPFTITCLVTDFSPAISVSLSNTDCDSLADLTISVSQDAGEVDMLSALYTSNVGSFDISNMNIGDVIGSALLSANSGSNTFNAELTVTTVVSSSEVVITSTDINTGLVLGSFTILNLNPGISISATTVPDGNNFTSGNSSTITFMNVFINPGQSSLVFTTTLDSELGDQDIQSFPFTITCLVTDFSPAISVSLSNTDCDSLADLTISVSQDAGEVDMLSALYTSNVGSFDISNMNIGDVIGSALLSANSGSNTFNAELTVTTVVSSSEVVITSTDINTGLVLGSFTILNLNPGISISATTVPDGNNFTSGNSSTITFMNVFINPGQSSLVFTTTLDSELGDQDIQSFPFTITCLVTDFSPAISVSLSNTDCDSLADLTISVSQDAGEVDMLSALYTSNVGSFDISNMNIGDVIGSALLSANSGSNTFNAELTVTTVVSSSEVVITSTDINTGLVLGSFTILNLNPGISISATTVPDGNNFTSGNSSTITFMNVFINPGQSSLVFTTTLDSELGDQDIQSFPFTITCLVTDFSPAISVSLSNTDCDSLADLTISVSQDAGEVDMLSALYTSNVGSFDISNMNIGDVIGSALLSANSGSNTFNAELTVTTVVSSSEVVITSTDINTGLVLGSFTILNLNPGISISATTVPDGNNFTSGNSSTITFMNVFINPGQSSLVFTTTLDSELGDQDIQSFPFTITCLVTDFSPAISVSLSNTDCDSLADLTISVSQDAGEVDMLSALYTSNVGSFDISNMNIGDVIGSALLSANSGSNTFNAELTVTTVVSSSEVVITSTDINTGLVLGSFTILNLNPGISISATTVPDGNNFTSGNSSTTTFTNVFINPGQSSLVFTTTLDSELGDQDIQSFPFTITCLLPGCTDPLAFNYDVNANTDDGSCIAVALGCTDPLAFNYDVNANTDDGSCIAVALGCTDPLAFNYDVNANTDDGSCIAVALGCTDPLAFNYDVNANTDDGSCIAVALGCTDPLAFNYDVNANTDDGSCIAVALGCTDPLAFNYDVNANTDDGSCIAVALGCTDPLAFNYDATANTDDGSCIAVALGCTDPLAFNYDVNANTDDGSCIAVALGCTDPLAFNYDVNANTDDGSCIAVALGCTDPLAFNYDVTANTDDGSCIAVALGCTDPLAFNYDVNANTDDGSCIAVALGCTDPLAFNYDATANTDDGSCIAVALGCTDPLAFNYDATANTDDGSCIAVALGCTDPLAFNYDVNANTDDGSCIAVALGCTDPLAFNYDVNANTDDGSCIAVALGCTDPLAFNYDATANTDDGSCIAVALGCTDPLAFNYDVNANTDDGSCIAVALGCTDPLAFNYDVNANTDDGSCIAVALGCTDPLAFNYDVTANTDDGSCIAVALGCTDPLAFNYDVNANTDDGSCIAVALGCTDPLAFNYDVNANTDDGSCIAVALGCTDPLAFNYDATANTDDGSCIAVALGCTDPLAFNYDVTANTDDGSCIAVALGCTDPLAFNYDVNANTDDGSCIPFIFGCTDPLASNYNPTVNTDDGSCLFGGCLDSTANNYDPTADFDDGSCLYTVISGCTDPLACNYYQFATLDDGSCNYATQYYDCFGNCINDTDGDGICDELEILGCTDILACNYDVNATDDNGSCTFTSTSLTSHTSCDSYFWNGINYNTSGTYSWLGTNADGCDSTATLILVINNTITVNNMQQICFGETYNFNGNTYTASGFYVDTFISVNGCDSIINTDLTVLPELVVSIQSQSSTTFCFGDDVDLSTSSFVPPSSTYQWNDINGPISGATSATYTATVSGDYSLTVTTSAGCVATSSAITVTVVSVTAPTGLYTDNIQLDRATMNWTAVANAHHYDIRMREAGSSTWTINLNNLFGTSKQKLNLNASTDYEWEIRSACSAGNSNPPSSWSTTQTFTTLTPCTAPLNPVTTGVGLDDATLNWDAVSGAYAYIIRYKATFQNWSSWTYDTITATTYSLTGLFSGGNYHWQVKTMCAADGSNNSGFTSLTNFTTLACNISLSTSYSNVGCYGGNDGSIDLTVSNGSGSYSYLWSDGSTTEDLTFLLPGIYSVLVTDNNTSCTESISVTISEPATAFAVSIQSQSSTTFCFGDDVDLSTSSFVPPSSTYQWNDINGPISGATSATYTATVSGDYSLTVTTSAGCVATSSAITVTVVSVTAPTGLYTDNIQLDRATMNWTAVANAHHYDIRMREAGSSTWTINLNNLFGTSKQKVNLVSGTDYEWEIRSACSAGNSNPPSSWSTTQTFTTLTPCTAPLNPVTTGVGLDDATLNWDAVSGAYAYIIRYKATFQNWSSWTYDTITATTYSLTGLFSGGNYHWQVKTMCAADGSNNSGFTSLTNFTTLACNISLSTSYSNVGCYGGNDGSIDLTVSNGSGSYSYLWSDGSTTEDLTFLLPGIYSVLVTDNNTSCTESISVTISEPATAFAVSIQSQSSTTFCFGDDVDLSTSSFVPPSSTYQWNDINGPISGATSATYTATVSGDYSLTVTTSAGCVATSSAITVTVVSVTAPTGLYTDNIQLDRATMNWTAVANAHHYDIRMREAGSSTWTINLNNLFGTSKQKVNLVSGTDYEWEIRSACSAGNSNPPSSWSTTQTFTTLTPCTAPLNPVTTGVGLDDATLNWDAVSGAYAYIIRYKATFQNWSSWTYDTITATTYSLTGLFSGGNYHWQVKTMCAADGSNNSGFTSLTNFTTLACNISLSTSYSNVGCYGGNDGSIDLTVSNGSGSYSYLWSDGSTTEDLTFLLPGIYSVLVTDNNTSCTESISVTISEPATAFAVSIQSQSSTTFCFGDDVDLSTSSFVPPSSTYQWNDINGPISGATSATYTATVSGDYSLTVTTSAGCVATSSAITVTVVSVTAPTGLYTDNIQLDRATMNWTAVANAHHYDIRMREAGSSTWTINLNNLFGTSKQKVNLVSGTDYEWEIRSACSAGNSNPPSSWSTTQTFTTLTPCTAPLNPVTTGVGLDDATLNWDAVSGAYAYIIRYKATFQNWSSWTYDTITATTYSLTGLFSGGNYHWQVKTMCAADGSNNSGFTSLTNFTTLACNISLSTSYSNVGCYGGNDGSIDLTVSNGSGSYSYLWSDGSTTEDLTFLLPGIYSVLVTDNNTSCTESISVTISEPATAFAVSIQSQSSTTFCFGDDVDLSTSSFVPPSSTYQWNDINGPISGATSATYTATVSGDYSLTVTTSAGCVATSSAITVTVVSVTAPTGLYTDNIQLDRATMNWTAVANAHHYDIRMREAGSSTWTINLNNLFGTSKQKVNLVSGTDYEWEIRSACSAGNSNPPSSWSTTQTFTTVLGCLVPLNPVTTGVGLDDATLNWDAVSGIYAYVVRYKQTNGGWNTWVYDTITATTYSLNGLIQATNYHWQVKTMCAADGSNNSAFTSYNNFSTINNCSQPGNLNASSVDTTSATLNWDAVSSADHYKVQYLKVGDAWNTRVDTLIYLANSLDIFGLLPNENYRWRVRTHCNSTGSYNSGWVAWDTLTTLSNRLIQEEFNLNMSLNVYPNPARGSFNISFISEELSDFEIHIFDAFGNLVIHEELRNYIGQYTKSFDLSNNPKGVYMLQIRTREQFISKRIVIQ